jgi:hypothetical protein
VNSQAALVNIQRVSKDCALSEVTGDGLDTVGVWGSNPHAPTIFIYQPVNSLATSRRTRTFLNFRHLAAFLQTPKIVKFLAFNSFS